MWVWKQHVSTFAHSRWKVEGTDCTQNCMILLLRMTPVHISTMPLATVEITTVRINGVEIWSCGGNPRGATRKVSDQTSSFLLGFKKCNHVTSVSVLYLQHWCMWHYRWPEPHQCRHTDIGWGESLRPVDSSQTGSGCSSAALWSHTHHDSPWLKYTRTHTRHQKMILLQPLNIYLNCMC